MGLNIKPIRPNLWYLDVRVRRAEDGGLDRKRETFEGNYQAAAARYVELRKQIVEAAAARCEFHTFHDLLNWYAGERPPSDKDLNILQLLDRAFGKVPIPAFPDRFAAWRKHVLVHPNANTGRPLANGTVNRYTALVRAAFALAKDHGIIGENPITKFRFPRLDEIPRDTVLSPETLRMLLNVIERRAPWLLAITRFALQVPCRRSELERMTKEDLDLINNLIRVRNGTTKNDVGIWKPIPPDMVEYFRNLPRACAWLFYRPKNGRYLRLGDFKKAWAGCLEEAGISDFHFHDTRHMAATDLLNRGTPPQAVQNIAGWKTDMMRVYYHRDSVAAAKLAKFAPEGVGTLGGYTPDSEIRNEAAG